MADLDIPASRVRVALAAVFGPVTAIGDGFDAFARIRLNLDPESIDLYDYLEEDRLS